MNAKAPAPNPDTTRPDTRPLLSGNHAIGIVRVGRMARFWPTDESTPKEKTTDHRLPELQAHFPLHCGSVARFGRRLSSAFAAFGGQVLHTSRDLAS